MGSAFRVHGIMPLLALGFAALLVGAQPPSRAAAYTWGAADPISGPNSWVDIGALVAFGTDGSVVGYTQNDDEETLRAYLRRTEGGIVELSPLFGNAGAHTYAVSLGSHNRSIDAVWIREGGQGPAIRHRHSSDGGLTWSDAQDLTRAGAPIGAPRVDRDGGGRVVVGWTNWRTKEVFVRVSTDGGVTFKDARRIATLVDPGSAPSVAVAGGIIMVAYATESGRVIERHSFSNGRVWSIPSGVGRGTLGDPYVAAAGKAFLIAYTRERGGDFSIRISRRTPAVGGTHPVVELTTAGAPDAWRPVLFGRGGIWRVAYTQCAGQQCSGTFVRYRESIDGGATWSARETVGDTGLGNFAAGVAANDSGPLAVWTAFGDTAPQAFSRQALP